MALPPSALARIRQKFGERLQTGVELARYTSARVGGPAEALVVANSVSDLQAIVTALWELELPFILLGGGSNVLVSDQGLRTLVVLNRSREVQFRDQENPPTVWAESGANFGALARQAATRGLSGLEWAAGIPGSLGGAVQGNAGAFGGDMAGNLLVAEILHHTPVMEANEHSWVQRESWSVDRFEYAYRSSVLKRHPGAAVVLAATLRLSHSTPAAVQAQIDEFTAIRHRTQPPGASMGSMFKNPPGDYAGRLIEAAGLKGAQVGGAQISPLHANFFINQGHACANDIYQLIEMARTAVEKQVGIRLELEIQLLGDWPVNSAPLGSGQDR